MHDRMVSVRFLVSFLGLDFRRNIIHYVSLLIVDGVCLCLHPSSWMDWQGQKLAEQLMQILLVGFAVVAFATGYALGSFQTMLLVFASGVVITTLITVPNWPLFNQHPLNWLDPSEAEKHPKPHVANSSSKKKTNKK